MTGKFHGVMATTTPRGRRITRLRTPAGIDCSGSCYRVLFQLGRRAKQEAIAAERERLGDESIGFISFLESSGVMPPAMREMVVDRAMAAGSGTMDLDEVKIIVLMIFWSLGEEPDSLILDELFVAPQDRLIH